MSVLPKEDLALKELACSRKSFPIESDEYLSYGFFKTNNFLSFKIKNKIKRLNGH